MKKQKELEKHTINRISTVLLKWLLTDQLENDLKENEMIFGEWLKESELENDALNFIINPKSIVSPFFPSLKWFGKI